ncbi:hypothetical protein J437_LFUL006592 [Ladona fulva]|uniref:2-methoxy-6-polyprenyl-1,4-benzoquinol methylase, mitochondrial n=1 Tax=Ladona fulva TaxID=123851 RepID=A0A8K0KH25_LADFU|nr:hypothetical protein J437_LFUL006592 [Ladona fulva]
MIAAQINAQAHSFYRQCSNNKNAFYNFLVYLSRNCSQKNVIHSENATHFGFQTVKEEEKERKGSIRFLVRFTTVHEVFETVAENYDKMNDAMSFGIHRIWKDEFIERLSPTPNTKLLDVAGGTGDISFRFLKYLEMVEGWKPSNLGVFSNSEELEKKVTICDINEAMLKVGRQRASKLGYENKIHWVLGNAENLPFEDNSYSAYTIAFGIRNVTHIQKVI